MHVLVIKTSSMGDVLHTLPALSDAKSVYPDIRFDWVVEDSFQQIPAWHPAVERVIPVHRIPKTTSGKLQRRFLGDAYLNGEYDAVLVEIDLLLDAAHATQQGDLSDTEFKLKAIFDNVVKDKSISAQDNFFETGISSLSLTEVHQQIDETYPGLVDVTDMFEYQSIAELATFIDEKQAG